VNVRPALLTLILAACGGIPENEFIPGYTTALCEHELICGDPAQLTFEGVLTVDDCVRRREAEVATWGVGCKYRAGDAAVCLEDMALLQCPAAEGTLADRPSSCLPVYFDCTLVEEVEAEDTDA
jgi:hypothetical protein